MYGACCRQRGQWRGAWRSDQTSWNSSWLSSSSSSTHWSTSWSLYRPGEQDTKNSSRIDIALLVLFQTLTVFWLFFLNTNFLSTCQLLACCGAVFAYFSIEFCIFSEHCVHVYFCGAAFANYFYSIWIMSMFSVVQRAHKSNRCIWASSAPCVFR